MGRSVESIAIKRGHTISHKLTKEENWTPQDLKGADAAIDFTEPDSAFDNIVRCFEARVPVAVGTTGWYEHFGEMEDACRACNGTILHSTNFSLGVNIFFELSRQLASIMDRYPAYNVSMQEIHHTEKLDSPSGTAITLAKDIVSKLARKRDWTNEVSHDLQLLGVESKREEDVPGTHSITWDSTIDSIELTHTAKNRDGFATGAVIAAEWLHGKNGIYTMNDLLNFN